MKLYFNPMSRAMTPRLLIAELGIDVEIVDIDFKAREHKTPEFIAKHPLGQLPCLELDDGSTMFETVAICQYLAEQAPDSGLFVPPGDPRRGLYLTFMVYGLGSVEPAAIAAYEAEQRGDEAKLKSMLQRIEEVVAVYATQLGDKPWLLGDDFTAVDVLAGSTLNWLKMNKRYTPQGALAGYVERFLSRPAIKQMTARYYGR